MVTGDNGHSGVTAQWNVEVGYRTGHGTVMTQSHFITERNARVLEQRVKYATIIYVQVCI